MSDDREAIDEQEAENQAIIRMLRGRVAKTRLRIDEIEEKRDELKRLDTQYRQEQSDLRDSIKGSLDILKVMVPPKTTEQMRKEIEDAVVDVLTRNAREGDDSGMAVSRILPMLEPDLIAEYEGKGIESRVRTALATLNDSGIVTFIEVDARNGKAKLWRMK